MWGSGSGKPAPKVKSAPARTSGGSNGGTVSYKSGARPGPAGSGAARNARLSNK